MLKYYLFEIMTENRSKVILNYPFTEQLKKLCVLIDYMYIISKFDLILLIKLQFYLQFNDSPGI